MKEKIKKWLKDGLALVPVVTHWAISFLTFFLPQQITGWLSSQIFKLTGNGYRVEEFLAFWNKKP